VEAARGIARESYTYSVPEGIDVVPGHRVTVPFGRRSTYGFVVSVGTEDPGVETFAIEVGGELAGVLLVTEENDPDYRHAGLDISL